LSQSKRRRSWEVTSSPLTKLLVRSLSLEDLLQDQVTSITLAHKPDMCSAQRESCRRERRLSIPLPSMRLMSSTQGPRVSWLCLQEILEKSNQRLESKSTRKLLSGEKREEQRLYQVSFSLMRSICLTLNASPSLTEHLNLIKLQLS
jgi:K+-sensing histidine kinase KdpD